MTAEVAVLNKSAVALAADSAMSVGNTGKTYPVNKLFALTKYRPIGIMVYNNAQFMGIPWETLVKMHRQDFGATAKDTVTAYAEDFLGYVSSAKICTDAQRQHNFLRITADLFRRIARDAAESQRNSSTQDVPHSDSPIAAAIEEYSSTLATVGESPSMADVNVEELVERSETEITELIDKCFSGVSIGETVRLSLNNILVQEVKSARLSDGFSGLVFAGFGEEEFFPSLVEVQTDGAVGQTIKVDTKREMDIARTGTHAGIVPFAQSEMVGRFMEGVDHGFLRYLEQYLGDLLFKSACEILEAGAPDGQLTEDQTSGLADIVATNLEDFRQSAGRFRLERFVNPVLDIVRHLPKEELASMAEALVNLTSLKRRVSMEEESVGGPIDVAVISKGDGFVWIKRKHYFDRLLNRDYLIRQSLRSGIEPGGQHAV